VNTQLSTLPAPLLPALECAAVLELFDRDAFAALLGMPPDQPIEQLLAHGVIQPEANAYRYSALFDPLASEPKQRALLHGQAASYYQTLIMRGEDSTAESNYVRHVTKQCDLLVRADPAALAPTLADVPFDQLKNAANRHVLRYYAGLGEGLADRLAAARALFTLLLAEPDLDPLVRGRALNSGALFAQMQGDHQAAIDAYRESLAIWQQLGNRTREANVRHNLGILHYELHQLEEAEVSVRAAVAIYTETNDHYHLAMSLNELGLIYRDDGRWQSAIEILERAAAIFEREDDEHALGIIYGNLGEVELALGHYQRAQQQFDHAIELMASQVYAVDYQINLGLMAQARNEDLAALAHYQTAQHLAETLGRREIAALIHYRIGHALQRLGRLSEASDSYSAAMDAIEVVRSPLRDQGLLISLMSRWQLVYEGALLLYLQQDDLETAFHVTERARARAFADQLARHAASESAPVVPMTASEARAALPADTMLLTYFATGLRGPETRLLDALPPEAAGLRDCLTTPARLIPLALTHSETRTFACSLNPNALQSAANSGDGARFLQPAILQRAYAALLAPLAAQIEMYERVVLVPHGSLHHMPFAALQSPNRVPLLEQISLSLTPSVTVLLRVLAERQITPTLPCLALGYDGIERGLRHTEAEAQAVATICSGQVWRGEDTTSAALIRVAGQYRYLHLACHGEFDLDDPLASWLEIGPGQRLSAEQILSDMHLNAELVVLSACRSGVSRVLRGDEPFGLARAMLAAGAKAVLVTLWPVEDSSARLLIERFYMELIHGETQIGLSIALRRAQQFLRGISLEDARTRLGHEPPTNEPQPYADPLYWAAYVLIG